MHQNFNYRHVGENIHDRGEDAEMNNLLSVRYQFVHRSHTSLKNVYQREVCVCVCVCVCVRVCVAYLKLRRAEVLKNLTEISHS